MQVYWTAVLDCKLDWLVADIGMTSFGCRRCDLLRKCGAFVVKQQLVGLQRVAQFYVLPTQCIYVFCVDLRTNSHYFPIQH